jgi:hypothetical protein
MLGVIAFGLALALFMLHFIERSIPISYALVAFVAAAVVAAGDLKEAAGQACTTTTAASGAAGQVCDYRYAVKLESLAALVASVGFAVLTLVVYTLERLAAAAGGWAA